MSRFNYTILSPLFFFERYNFLIRNYKAFTCILHRLVQLLTTILNNFSKNIFFTYISIIISLFIPSNIYIPNFFTRREKKRKNSPFYSFDRNNLGNVNFTIRIRRSSFGSMVYGNNGLPRPPFIAPRGLEMSFLSHCGSPWIGQQKRLSKRFRHANKKLLFARDRKQEVTSGAPL